MLGSWRAPARLFGSLFLLLRRCLRRGLAAAPHLRIPFTVSPRAFRCLVLSFSSPLSPALPDCFWKICIWRSVAVSMPFLVRTKRDSKKERTREREREREKRRARERERERERERAVSVRSERRLLYVSASFCLLGLSFVFVVCAFVFWWKRGLVVCLSVAVVGVFSFAFCVFFCSYVCC